MPFDVSELLILVSCPCLLVSQPAAPGSQANLVSLFSECVIAFYPEVRAICAPFFLHHLTFNQVKIPMSDEGTLLVELLNWGIRHAKTSGQRECASHIVAAIVNKHSAGDE
jgi:hypothetical protein